MTFLFPVAIRPWDFRGPTTAGGKKRRPATDFSFADALHPTESAAAAAADASSKYVRTDGGKCSTKISGIPDTIGSTNPEARKGIHHLASGRVHPNVPSLYFPNNSPLKSNFANISARQLCLLPFRFSLPKGSVHHRNRGRRETFSASAVQTWPRSTTLT